MLSSDIGKVQDDSSAQDTNNQQKSGQKNKQIITVEILGGQSTGTNEC